MEVMGITEVVEVMGIIMGVMVVQNGDCYLFDFVI
jgi:hypothetical protein